MARAPNELEEFHADLAKAINHTEEVEKLLRKHVTSLDSDQRKAMPKPTEAFLVKGGTFVEKVIAHPEVTAAGGHDPKVIINNLATAALLEKLETKLAGTKALVADGLLTTRAAAWTPALQIYGVAQNAVEANAKLQEIVTTGREFFPHHPKKAKKQPPKTT